MSQFTVDKQQDYYSWLTDKGIQLDISFSEKKILSVLQDVGITCSSVYDETNPLKIRLYVSELIMKREKCNIEFVEYLNVILLLLALAEYVEAPKLVRKENKEKNTNNNTENNRTRDALTIAYYLSRNNKDALSMLHYKTFSEAFKQLAVILKQKPSTLKNMRDEFDPYFDNGRAGWYQRQLRASRKEVFDIYKDKTDQELYQNVISILDSYKSKDKDGNCKKAGHTTIHITNNTLKVIKG